MAPIYSHFIAHTNPFNSTLDATTTISGKVVPVLEASTTGLGLGVTPIGPTWNLRGYFLGADGQGRDVMARLLYGGRNTLLIGLSAGVICILLALLIGVVAGYRKGWICDPFAASGCHLGFPGISPGN
jgi:peptide/nickel transport system permease protein